MLIETQDVAADLGCFVPLDKVSESMVAWVRDQQTFFRILENAVSFTSTNCYVGLGSAAGKYMRTNHLELVEIHAKLFQSFFKSYISRGRL